MEIEKWLKSEEQSFINFLNENGYECKTDLFNRLIKVEIMNGINGIHKEYKSIYKDISNNKDGILTLIRTLNFLAWERFGVNDAISEVYDDLWAKLETKNL